VRPKIARSPLRTFLILCFAHATTAFAGSDLTCEKNFADLAETSKTRAKIDIEHPEVRELKVREVDSTVLQAIKEKNATYSYVVDGDGHVFAVEGSLPYSEGNLQVAAITNAQGKRAVIPVHESGAISYDPKTKKFAFRQNYSLDLSKDERASVMAQMQKRVPGANFQPNNTPEDVGGSSYSQVLTCADILSGHLAGKNYALDRIITRNLVSLSVLGIKEFDIQRKYSGDPEALSAAQRKLFLVFGVDTFRRTGTTYVGGIVGRQLVERKAGPLVNYGVRLGTGMASNFLAKEATDQLDPLLKNLQTHGQDPGKHGTAHKEAELTPAIAWNIMLYNNGTQMVSPPISSFFDHKVLETAPMNYFEACRQGKPLKFFVSPRMMRVYESGIMTIIGLPKYFLWGV